ncbi:MAG: DUF368 domain-containing protein, partial [Bacteroidota bacterium]|nr:DUF368 domain-containing protein [Bacteroidota bacterium]MDX5505557.1 DUF368 domain-containing protein [Bacteroidota bacterium]
ARLITYLLEHEPVAIWSFFFGLVLASIPFVGRKVRHWTTGPILGFFAGAILAYWITVLPMSTGDHGMGFIFLSGMIAICAMILPGISGSFILLLLGAYTTVLTAIKDLDVAIIAIFALGAVIGLLSFARVLKWMFGHYHDLTVAILSGFLLGSLNKIWPWKRTVEEVTKPSGEVVPVLQDSVLPSTYENMGFEADFMLAVGLFFVGILTIVVLEKVGQKRAS